MASEDVQTNIRLPADLKDRLVASAGGNNRSLSAEVASRLEDSFATKQAMDLVLDQALQIKELRGKVMEANFTMSQALSVLRGFDENRDEAIQALTEAIGTTAEDARSYFEKLINDHVARTSDTELNFLKENLKEIRSKKSKP